MTGAVAADTDPAGAVCEVSPLNVRAGSMLRDLGIPVVWASLGAPRQSPPGSAHVWIDERPGMHDVLSRLEIQDDSMVAILVGPQLLSERMDAVKQTFPGRTVVLRAESWGADGGYDAAARALKEGGPFGAIVCASDLLASGAIGACLAHGHRVPEEISVIGFGGFQVDPGPFALTSVRWPLRELTTAAFDALIDHVERRDALSGVGDGDPAPLFRMATTAPESGRTARLADRAIR